MNASIPHNSFDAAAADGMSQPRIGLVCTGSVDGHAKSVIAQAHPLVTRTIAIQTDLAALLAIGADRTILIRGGSGAEMYDQPSVRQIVKPDAEHAAEIEAAIADLDLIFILSELGETDSVIAMLVVHLAKQNNKYAMGIALEPPSETDSFSCRRQKTLMGFQQHAGATVFPIFDAQLRHGAVPLNISQVVNGLIAGVGHALIPKSSFIDRADLLATLKPENYAAMGFSHAEGLHRSERALEDAIAHPLLSQDRLKSASGILINVRGSAAGLMFKEVRYVLQSIGQHVNPDTKVLFTTSRDESVGDQLVVSIFASLESKSKPCTIIT